MRKWGTRAAIALGLIISACGERPAAPVAPAAVPGPEELAAHSEEFRREVIRVTDGVYVAVGFGLANSILIEGDDGVIIVDTMESLEAAETVKAEFAKITSKPVRAIIYTHNHADHVFGARAFTEGRPIPVYGQALIYRELDRFLTVVRPAIYTRSMRMFGTFLPPGDVLNAGIGPFLASGHGRGTLALVRPTDVFDDERRLTIAGVELQLVHAPGETDDQLFVWIPAKRALLSGDNIYKSFPNLYTIRGTSYRDVVAWVHSLDAMRALHPEHLVPSHTRPLSGAETIAATLTAYRDAIQFVHDQTVRGMNRGLTPDQLVEVVTLPPHLANHPFLREYYGTVAWSVRSIFAGYLGWFDGDAATLTPLSPTERAERMAALAEQATPLRDAAAAALARGDHRWAAELAADVLRLHPDDAEVRKLEAQALRALGAQQLSANGRSYFLTQALELEGAVTIRENDPAALPEEFVRNLPIDGVMRSMAVNLDPERSAEFERVVGFTFPDIGAVYTVHVRRGVAEVQPVFPDKPDLSVRLDSLLWKEVLMGRRNPVVAFASGAVRIDGSPLELIGFLRLFQSRAS